MCFKYHSTQSPWAKAAVVVAHVGMAGSLLWRARRVDLSQPRDIYGCYMHVWRLFYLQYLVVPLCR